MINIKLIYHRYFGHGGAEQYIRSKTVRNLDQCATVLLMGCSSGRLTSKGEFEPNGTPLHYLIGGRQVVWLF
jgi:separase